MPRVQILPLVLGLLLARPATAALDLASMWDFARPDVSEQRFRDALQTARGDDALVLQTQIARTHGLRRDFAQARAILRAMEPALAGAGPEARVRHALETGRSLASATHPPDAATAEARAEARRAFERAEAEARAAGLDALAIDAIHMLAFVDTAPADQLKWAQAALAVALGSAQPDARRWEASIRHNLGHALNQLGRHDEALTQFEQALAIRARGSNAGATRVARWMVARTLRHLGRNDEALALQLALEREADAAGQPDPHVFAELEQLYRDAGVPEKARLYAERRAALGR
jgi:tetratricopeptide (TPR) repeat protein